jgi:hypothetical protein
VRGFRHGALDLALLDLEVLQDVVVTVLDLIRAWRKPEIEDWRLGIDLDIDGGDRPPERLPIRVGEKQHRFVHVPDPIGGEDGLVFLDEVHAVRAGDVLVIDDRELGPVHRITETDAPDSTAWGRASHGGTPQTAVHRQIVDVQFPPGEFGEALDALHVSPPAWVPFSRLNRDRI